jgi:hypothetical protein
MNLANLPFLRLPRLALMLASTHPQWLSAGGQGLSLLDKFSNHQISRHLLVEA